MNRNTESRFALNPTNVSIGRSKLDLSHGNTTTFNVGDIIPIDWLEVLPGDTFKHETNAVVRLQTPLTPFMGRLMLDTYHFFIPNRLIWSHWREFNGENTTGPWAPETTYTTPKIKAPDTTGFEVGTIADYLGFPVGVPKLQGLALPFRAYALVMNEWFRSEAIQDPLNIPLDETLQTGTNGGTFVTDVVNGGKPYKACKLFDFFTSCLPSPQRGESVPIPIGSFDIETSGGNVVGNGYGLGITNGTAMGTAKLSSNTLTMAYDGSFVELPYSKGTSASIGADAAFGVPTLDQLGDHPEYSGLTLTGMENTLTYQAGTINALRQAFSIQRFLEKNARFGGRYISQIKAHFGVDCPDYRLQRPEYLGGTRVPLNVSQTVQSSETGTTPLGTTGAFSLTGSSHFDFEKSFSEHGIIISLAVVRYQHDYQQGMNKAWLRDTLYDYYFPEFANLGEVGVKNVQIFAQGPDAVNAETGKTFDEEIFGYQEYGAEYRHMPNIVTGEMRSAYTASLDKWHLADDYEELPHLSSDWLMEDKTNVDRVLAVTSSVSNQLLGDFWFAITATRPMPLYSIPGLIDHH